MLYPVELGAQNLHSQNRETFKNRKRNLLNHQRSGNYYTRTFAGGKEIWKSFKTSRCVSHGKLVYLQEKNGATNPEEVLHVREKKS